MHQMSTEAYGGRVYAGRNVRRRFTLDPAVEGFGAWSPDRGRLVFHATLDETLQPRRDSRSGE
jgi:hypothetical protein